MQDAATQLARFNEELDTVGMTAAQAGAMRTATEGENALADDRSAAANLLNAIMSAIRGEDSNIGGRNQQLNPISLSINLDSGFGLMDGQAIASHDGANLYTAVYGRCREAVRSACTDRSLQRAVTAYLMTIEQDCNTLQTQVDNARRTLSGGVRESGAMLELARVQNRRHLNQNDMTACLREVEQAVQTDQVCGRNYRKCLDNGQFIDVNTGRPFEGVVEFYRLASLLTFADNISLADQRLARIPSNREFVQNFERRVRQFAEPVLNTCVEIRDDVWAAFLDKALLEIYYAQTSKVNEIRQGCMDFVSACFMGGEQSLTAAMSALTSDTTTNQPDFLAATGAVCDRYVAACNNMFSGNIIADFVATRTSADTVTACRTVVRNCFERFGGLNFVNFFSPHSGLFQPRAALDWFSFESGTCNSPKVDGRCTDWNSTGVPSACARELLAIESCNPPGDPEFARRIFGGFTKLTRGSIDNNTFEFDYGDRNQDINFAGNIAPTGVASEVYHQIVDILRTNCANRRGRFFERRIERGNRCNSIEACPWHQTGEVDEYSWGVCMHMCPVEESRCTGPRHLINIKDLFELGCIDRGCACLGGQVFVAAEDGNDGECRTCPTDSTQDLECVGSTNNLRCPSSAPGCMCHQNRIFRNGACVTCNTAGQQAFQQQDSHSNNDNSGTVIPFSSAPNQDVLIEAAAAAEAAAEAAATFFESVTFVSQGQWCPANSICDNRCTGFQQNGGEGGCIRDGCRCNSCFEPKEIKNVSGEIIYHCERVRGVLLCPEILDPGVGGGNEQDGS